MQINSKKLLKNFDNYYETDKNNINIAKLFKSNKVPAFKIIIFLKQLANLLASGIDLHKAFEIIINSEKNIVFLNILKNIQIQIANGNKLSTCFKKYPNIFDKFTIQFIETGEMSGKLAELLEMSSIRKEKQFAFSNKIMSAMLYPLFISLAAVLLSVIMLVLVIPKFVEVFNDMDLNLPEFTRMILFISDAIKTNFHIGIFIGVFYIAINNLPITQKYCGYFNSFIFNSIPGVKFLKNRRFLLLFSQNLAINLSSGIPINTAIDTLANTENNKKDKQTLLSIKLDIEAGCSLYAALKKHPAIPDIFLQLVKVGDETGSLDKMLDNISKIYTDEVDYFINRISQIIEPLIITVLGVLIGGLVIAIYLPIFNLGNIL